MTARRRFDEKFGDPIKDVALLGGTIRTEESISKEDFILICEKYPDLQIERETNGKLQIISLVKFGSGKRVSIVNGYLFIWWIKNKAPRPKGTGYCDHNPKLGS